MRKILIALFVTGMIACEKEESTVEYRIGQTQCADKWGYGTNDAETKQKLIDYLASKNISLKKISLTTAPEGIAVCLACTCPSGRTFIVTIDKKDEEKIKAEGFTTN